MTTDIQIPEPSAQRALHRYEKRARRQGLDATADTLRDARIGRTHVGWIQHMVQHCTTKLTMSSTWPQEATNLLRARFLFSLAADAMDAKK